MFISGFKLLYTLAVSIADNLACIRERIARSAARVGRRPEEITIVAVSKTFPVSAIREAHAAGLRHFGENRVQEWEGKQPLLADLAATWHLVGHLQSNKVSRAVSLFHTIDSVDRLPLAEKLARTRQEPVGAQQATPLQVLIEVRLAPEDTKSGVIESGTPALAEAIVALPQLDLRGLMAIPPFTENPEDARPYFRRLRQLRDSLCRSLGRTFPELSMGMSHDFEVAIAEGATQVRLGTAIFGSRM